jgi:hypothetical protein
MGYQINTDFSGIEPATGGARNTFPVSDAKGWLGRITMTEANENTNKDGVVLHVVVTGDEGPVAGKTHDHYINVVHPKQETVKYAQQEMSAIGHCVGHVRVGNTDEWLNKPLRVLVVLDPKNQENYPGSTKIAGWRDVNGNKPGEAGLGAGQRPAGQQWQPQPQGQQGGFQQQQPPQGTGFQQQPQGQPQGGAPGWTGQPQQQQPQTQPQGGFQQQQPQGGGFDPNAGQGGGYQQQQQPQGGGFQQQPQQTQQPQQQPNPNNINPNGNGAGWQPQQQGAPSWTNNGG